MLRRRLRLGAALLTANMVVACAAEEPLLDAEAGPLCGVSEPLKLLELGPSERLLDDRGLSRIGERYYVHVADGEQTTTYSVGLCGEDPKIIARDLRSVPFTLPRWPDAPVACGPDGDVFAGSPLVALDPLGESAPVELLARGCADGGPDYPSAPRSALVNGGLVTLHYGELEAGLTFHPYADSPTPAFQPGLFVDDSFDFAFLDDELIASTGARELVRVGFPDLEREVLAPSAGWVAATAAHLLYASWSAPESVLRDRHTGIERILPCAGGGLHVDAHVAALSCHDYEAGGISAMFLDLATGDIVHRGEYASYLRRLDDGRVLINDNGLLLLDLETGSEATLVAGSLVLYDDTADDDGLLARRGGQLLRVDFNGRVDVLATDPTTAPKRLADGRVVVGTGADDSAFTLVVIANDTSRRLIDDDVIAFTDGQRSARAPLSAGVDPPALPALGPNMIAYQVADGERSGLYLLNLGDAQSP